MCVPVRLVIIHENHSIVLPFHPIADDRMPYVFFFPFPRMLKFQQIQSFKNFSPGLSGFQEGLHNDTQAHVQAGWSLR